MPMHIAWDNHLVVNLAKFITSFTVQGGAGVGALLRAQSCCGGTLPPAGEGWAPHKSKVCRGTAEDLQLEI